LKLPKNMAVFNGEAETIVISKNNVDFSKQIDQQICDLLVLKNINSVIVEGGKHTLQTFIDANLWDEARVFTVNISFGKGIKAQQIIERLISEENIMSDSLKIFSND